jgi:hypothetical protein
MLKGNDSSVIRNNGNGLTTSARLDGFYITGGKSTSGAGMFNYNCSPSIVNCYFSADTVTGSGKGGGMHNAGTSAPQVTNCTFTGNMAMYGGAMFNDSLSAPQINSCSFIGNRASYTAGIFNYYNTPVVSNCTFSGNILSATDGSGAGMQNRYSSAIVTNCVFLNNKGQGINPAFANGSGGGGLANFYCSSVAISYCTFTNNEASYGGGLYDNHSFSDITHCSFTGNTAYDAGGYGNYGATAYVANSSFISNIAYASGGGGMQNMLATATVVNCLFAKNFATSGPVGAGMNNYVSTVNITNCTFSGNWATHGGGISNYGTSPVITNTVMWGNTPEGIDPMPAANIRYSLIQGMAADALNHNLAGTINPLFTNATANNYQLISNSPCINAGTNDSIPAGVLVDLAGNTRIMGTAVDMGAYENMGSPLPLRLISFTGKNTQGHTQLLTWATAGEDGLKEFDLEHSADGESFSSLRILPAAGYGAGRYSFENSRPLPVNFYRLRMVDHQGSVAYSSILKLDISIEAQSSKVYPNPAKDLCTLVAGTRQLIHTVVTLMDIYGNRKAVWTIEDFTQPLSLKGIAPGMYMLKLENGELIKIIKE